MIKFQVQNGSMTSKPAWECKSWQRISLFGVKALRETAPESIIKVFTEAGMSQISSLKISLSYLITYVQDHINNICSNHP